MVSVDEASEIQNLPKTTHVVRFEIQSGEEVIERTIEVKSMVKSHRIVLRLAKAVILAESEEGHYELTSILSQEVLQ